MGKKILDSKALYMVLSIIIAVSLWFYVASLEGNEDEKPISNIPVQFEGVDILEEKNLMIVGDAPTVTVRVRAPLNILAHLDKNNVTATVDVSQISSEGTTTQGYTVSYPSSASGSITTVSRSPDNVSFTVARYQEREVEIQGSFTGSVAEGFVPGDAADFKFSPATVTISGQALLVNQIHHVLVTVPGEELTESIAGDYPYQLIGNDGEVLDAQELDVTCSVDTVYTTFPIRATKEIPLKVNLTDGGGLTANSSRLKYTIEPKSIMVAGSKADVDAISELVLTSVDLSNIRDGDVLTVKIPLRDELENLSGTREATVSFKISGMVTKSVETTNITCTGVPEGWQYTLVTKAMTVELRGTAAALADITGENVQVAVDLSDVKQAAGQYTVTPRVYLDNVGSDAGVLGTDYRVVVSLARAAG